MRNTAVRFIVAMFEMQGSRQMVATNPFNAAYDLDRVTRGWWALIVSGIISIVAGGIILYTDWKVDDLAVFIGAVLVFRGLVNTLGVPVDGSGRGWAIALGLLEFALGLMVWIWPSPTLLVIAFWVGWYVLFSGILTIAGAVAGRDYLPYWGFLLVFGIAEVLLAFWLLARPGTTLVAAVLALGLWCLVYGVTQIVIAFEIKRLRDGAARMDGSLRDLSTPSDLHHATG
jgi:uncharacterized membrane protein HdeD (DUF308 family)